MNSHPILAVLFAAATTLTGCATGQWPQPPAAMPATGPGPTTAAVTAQIPRYDRDAFGGWIDTDRPYDGCDSREEVLERDAADRALDNDGDGCRDDGPIVDLYTGHTITARGADIDHVVALQDAWESGAWAWTETQRIAYANDQANLRAVSASGNRSKGSDGPDEWHPEDPAATCPYVTIYWTTKQRYHLTVTPSQEHALWTLCPGGGS